MRRDHNEDNLVLVPRHQLYVVADGMGGHSSGEVASKIAVETLEDFFEQTSEDEDVTWPYREDKSISYEENRLAQAIKLANLRIYEKSLTHAKYKQMGTTIVGLLFHDDKATAAHVGDSRIYVYRRGELRQLTEDHSLLNDYKKIAQLSKEEEANFPHKNIIVRALGMKDTVIVDHYTMAPEHGDIFLLCSDGLTGEVTDEQITQILIEADGDLEGAVERLIQTACENGGKDNVTAVLVQVVLD
jgi:protein phosphatase